MQRDVRSSCKLRIVMTVNSIGLDSREVMQPWPIEKGAKKNTNRHKPRIIYNFALFSIGWIDACTWRQQKWHTDFPLIATSNRDVSSDDDDTHHPVKCDALLEVVCGFGSMALRCDYNVPGKDKAYNCIARRPQVINSECGRCVVQGNHYQSRRCRYIGSSSMT